MTHQDTATGAEPNEAPTTGWQLRTARLQAGISLSAMADRTGFNVGYLSEVERGNRPVSATVRSGYELELLRVQKELATVLRPSSDEPPQVVIAGTLRTLPRRELQHLATFVDQPIERVCQRLQLTWSAPKRTPVTSDIDAAMDTPQPVSKYSGALLAYVGVSDTRTGVEVAFAHMAQVPIVLLYEVGNARMADDFRHSIIPIYGEVPFHDAADLEDGLGRLLFWLFSFRKLDEAAQQGQWPSQDYLLAREQLEHLRRRTPRLPHPRPPISVEEWTAWRIDHAPQQLEAALALTT